MSAREEEYLTRLEQLTAVLQQQAEESRRELDESRDQQATAARRGELGPDWREVQARIDAGETTLIDVLSGQDQTPAAQRLHGLAQERIATLAEELPLDLQEEIAESEAELARISGVPRPRLVDGDRDTGVTDDIGGGPTS